MFTLLSQGGISQPIGPVYCSMGSNNAIVVDQKFEEINPHEEEKPQYKAAIKTIFVDLHIKDVYMSFLLQIFQELDDDLLLDAMELLVR